MRLSTLCLGLIAGFTAARTLDERAAPKIVLSHYMLGDITEEHAHKDIDDAIAMGLDGFVLNVGYPKLDWVSQTLSHLYGYADYLASQGGKFKLAISLDLYATGAWCWKNKLENCGGPKEYDDILKGFLGRDSYFRYGPDNFPFITSFSTGGKTNKDFLSWRKDFANQMYFMPGIDDTPGFWESHPAWWDYWGDLIDGASAWESAWPEVGATNEGDISRDAKVMGPLQKKGKGYMTPISMLQYKNAYGANLYRRGEMNMIKRMENILTMDPQPDIVQLLTWNDGPESHHFGNLWPEQNTDPQPNQYASPEGSDHTGLQALYSAFIHAWKNGGSMVPAFSKRDESLPQGALWHKTIFQDTSCPGGDTDVKYFQAPNGTDAGLDALHWSLVVPASAVGWTVDVMSNGKSISSTVLKAGLNYGTVEDSIEEGTQRLIIKNSGTVVAGTDQGRCLAKECHDGIYNFNPQVMPVKGDFDDSDCWQVEGTPILDYAEEKVIGVRDLGHGHGHGHGSDQNDKYGPFEGFVGCNSVQKDRIRWAWNDVRTILDNLPLFKKDGLLETRHFGFDIGMKNRTDNVTFIEEVFLNLKKLNSAGSVGREIRIGCKDIDQVGYAAKDINTCNRIRDESGTKLNGIGGYAFNDGTSSPGGTIVLCDLFFLEGQPYLEEVQDEMKKDQSLRKSTLAMNGKFRLLLHEMFHLPSISSNRLNTSKFSDMVISDQYVNDDTVSNANKAYMPKKVEKMARGTKQGNHRLLTVLNADTYAWYTVESFFMKIYKTEPNASVTNRDDDDDEPPATTTTQPKPTEYPTTYDCNGSGMCKTFEVKYCDHAVNSLQRNDDKNYGDGKGIDGNCWGDISGYGCKVFVTGKGCVATGNEMWWMYQDLRNSDKGGCDKCGSVHYGNGCRFTVNYYSQCDNH